MIKNLTPLSMAESTEYLGEEKDSEIELGKFIKRFVKLDSEDAKKMKIKIEALNMMKVKLEHITKVIDFLPEDAESLNKIFIDVSLDEDEAKKYLTLFENSNNENGKRRIRNNLRISAKWLSFGEENDAHSTSYRRVELNTP